MFHEYIGWKKSVDSIELTFHWEKKLIAFHVPSTKHFTCNNPLHSRINPKCHIVLSPFIDPITVACLLYVARSHYSYFAYSTVEKIHINMTYNNKYRMFVVFNLNRDGFPEEVMIEVKIE